MKSRKEAVLSNTGYNSSNSGPSVGACCKSSPVLIAPYRFCIAVGPNVNPKIAFYLNKDIVKFRQNKDRDVQMFAAPLCVSVSCVCWYGILWAELK